MSNTVEGYLLIADITGYTWYLSESELEHAQDTLTELLELLVDQTRPPLVISRLAGDAVISYGLQNHFLHGQTFIELIEDTYVAFRSAIQLQVMNNTCQCNACANVSRLDLKFFLHYGSFGIQRISDHEELVGSEVIVIHRLLKNSVTEKTGIGAYVLYTEAAVNRLDVGDFAESLVSHYEEYEHLGRVKVWIQDLEPLWDSRRNELEATILEEDIDVEISEIVEMPPERLWDYMMQPEYRNFLIGSDRMAISDRSKGRIGTGSVYQCYHGDNLIPQTIVSWQPFESIVISQPFPMVRSNTMMGEYRLETFNGGTRLSLISTKPTGPFPGRLVYGLMRPLFSRVGARNLAAFKQLVEREYRRDRAEVTIESKPDASLIRDAAAEGLQASTQPAKS